MSRSRKGLKRPVDAPAIGSTWWCSYLHQMITVTGINPFTLRAGVVKWVVNTAALDELSGFNIDYEEFYNVCTVPTDEAVGLHLLKKQKLHGTSRR